MHKHVIILAAEGAHTPWYQPIGYLLGGFVALIILGFILWRIIKRVRTTITSIRKGVARIRKWDADRIASKGHTPRHRARI